MLHGLNGVEETTVAVRQLLIQSAGDFLDIAQVAKCLHVSERTLRRLLDYAETVCFRRAFMRWNGVTPNSYRQQKMAESNSWEISERPGRL